MICDVCARQVRTLGATSRGHRGLNLCDACYRRLLRRERAEREAAAAQHPDDEPAGGPPYEWPRCELCGDDVDDHGLGHYTVDGKRRRFCSVECRQLHNARAGAPLRAIKMRQRVHSGLWTNPLDFTTHDERSEYGKRGGEARAAQAQAEIQQGTWVPPSTRPGAREKLSRPRKHTDDPVLHSALEKLTAGGHVPDLTDAEREAHNRYRRELAARNPERIRQRQRQAYRRRMSDPAKRAAARARYAAQGRKLCTRPPNPALTRGREAAGLTRAALAALLGVDRDTVRLWEQHSTVPRDPSLRRRVADLHGTWPWPDPPRDPIA